MINRKVRITIDGGQTPIYGKITKVIHAAGPAWPALFQVDEGTVEQPKLSLWYEFGDDYILDLI